MDVPPQSATDEGERLRRALRDPATSCGEADAARAAFVLRAHVLEGIDRALASAGLSALLVKGASLALTVYPQPWLRPMADLDLLVDPGEEARVLEALAAAGWARAQRPDAPRSRRAFAEVPLTLRTGSLGWLVEVHVRLDKLVPRPVPHRDLVARSSACPGLCALRVPAPEDHALLVILHLAASDFDHAVAWIDLALLMRSDFDWRAFEDRARAWRLGTAAWVALATLAGLGFDAVPEGLADSLRPSARRVRAIGRTYRVGSYPVAPAELPLGLAWVRRQTLLRDDRLRWRSGVLRYAVRRALERLRTRAFPS